MIKITKVLAPPMPPPPATYIFEVSQDVAQLLADITFCVAGPPTSRRGLTDAFRRELVNAGIKPDSCPSNNFYPSDMEQTAFRFK